MSKPTTVVFIVIFLVIFLLFPKVKPVNNPNVVEGFKGFGLKPELEQGIHYFLPYAIEKLKSIDFPPLFGETEMAFIGKVSFSLKDFKIRELKEIQKFQLQMNSPNMVSGRMSIFIAVEFQFSFKQLNFPNIVVEGIAQATSNAVEISLTTAVTLLDGKPHLKIHHNQQPNVKFGSLDISLNGNFGAWVMNMMIQLFKKSITGSLETSLRLAIIELMDEDLSRMIEESDFILPLIQPFNGRGGLSMDLHVQKLVVANQFSALVFRGIFSPISTVFNNKESSEWPENPPFGNRMAQALVSEMSLETLSQSLMTAGFLNGTFSDNDIPPDVPIRLDTDSLGNYIAELKQKYPLKRKCSLNVHMDKQPIIIVNSTGIYVIIEASLHLNVLGDDGHSQQNEEKVFIATLGLSTGLKVNIVDYNNGRQFNATGEIKRTSFSLKLKESFMEPVPNLERFEKFIQIILLRGAIESYNRQLKLGLPLSIPLPDWIQIRRTIVEFSDEKWVGIGGDGYFKFPDQRKDADKFWLLKFVQRFTSLILKHFPSPHWFGYFYKKKNE